RNGEQQMPQINTYLTSAAADLAPFELLKSVFARNRLLFVGQTASLADPLAFRALFNALRKKSWIDYAKNPFGSPVHVLDYLGRYTHRMALSNDRILSAHNAEVTFSYRDRKNQDRKKTMTLDVHEFIRRFLLHVIPKPGRAPHFFQLRVCLERRLGPGNAK